MSDRPRKDYLGDSVYADYDGDRIILTTENGDGPTNTIFLESSVLDALMRYAERLKRSEIDEQPA